MIETQVEWIQRHGGSPELSQDRRRWVFATGAMMDCSEVPECCFRHEPPDDPRARLEVQAAYWRAKIQRIARQMEAIKDVMTGRSDWFNWDQRIPEPQGANNPASVLEYLRGLAAEPKSKLAEVEAELAALPVNRDESIRQRRLKRALEKKSREAADIQRRAMAITI